MQIKIAAPLGGDAIIEFDDNEEVSGRLSIISGDITEDMIAEAIAGANPNSYMGFVNTLDAPASDVLRTLHLYAGWFVDWPAVEVAMRTTTMIWVIMWISLYIRY